MCRKPINIKCIQAFHIPLQLFRASSVLKGLSTFRGILCLRLSLQRKYLLSLNFYCANLSKKEKRSCPHVNTKIQKKNIKGIQTSFNFYHPGLWFHIVQIGIQRRRNPSHCYLHQGNQGALWKCGDNIPDYIFYKNLSIKLPFQNW